MNILGGVLQADSGEILLNGSTVIFETPAESLAPVLHSSIRNSI